VSARKIGLIQIAVAFFINPYCRKQQLIALSYLLILHRLRPVLADCIETHLNHRCELHRQSVVRRIIHPVASRNSAPASL
jgi:hypothetical protein